MHEHYEDAADQTRVRRFAARLFEERCRDDPGMEGPWIVWFKFQIEGLIRPLRCGGDFGADARKRGGCPHAATPGPAQGERKKKNSTF